MLRFTSEIGLNHKLNFLDVALSADGDSYKYSVYRKPTDAGIYINAASECPDRFKDGTIRALIHRTYKLSSNMDIFHASAQNLKQSFINNGYSNRKFDFIFKQYTEKLRTPSLPEPTATPHVLYYQNQFSDAYKIDERVIRNIVSGNVQCANPSEKLKLVIYYKPPRVSTLLSKNNQSPRLPNSKMSCLVYEYTCNEGECERLRRSYIGMTTTSLTRRLTMHLQSGAIKCHSYDDHDVRLARSMLDNRTKIIRVEHDTRRLAIYEALIIQEKRPEINNQMTGSCRTLKLFD